MVKIEAIIQPHRWQPVQDALAGAGVEAVTVTEVLGQGRQRGHTEVYRGQEYAAPFVPKLKIEIVAADSEKDAIIAAILGAARTGRIGDGKIFILPVAGAVRIRNGQIDEAALY